MKVEPVADPSRTPRLPRPVARAIRNATEPSWRDRHHLRPSARVMPVCAISSHWRSRYVLGVGTIRNSRHKLLQARGQSDHRAPRQARDVEPGPKVASYLGRVRTAAPRDVVKMACSQKRGGGSPRRVDPTTSERGRMAGNRKINPR